MRVGAVIDAVNDEHISTESAQQPLIVSYRRKRDVARLICSSLSAQLLIFLSPGVFVFGSQNWVGSAPPSRFKGDNAFSFVGANRCANALEGNMPEIEQATSVVME